MIRYLAFLTILIAASPIEARMAAVSGRAGGFGGGNTAGGGGGAGATLTLNAVSTFTSSDGSANLTISHTVGSSDNKLVVAACASYGSGGFSSASWINNDTSRLEMVEATRSVRGASGAAFTIIWVATGVSAGAGTAKITKTSGVGGLTGCGILDFYDAEQDPGIGFTEPSGINVTTSGTSLSTTCASNVGEIVVTILEVKQGSALDQDVGQTMQINTAIADRVFMVTTKPGEAGKTTTGGDWTGANHAEMSQTSIRPVSP